MKKFFKILFCLLLSIMISCSKDEMSQELASFVPHNKVVSPNKGEASDDEPIVEDPTDDPIDEPIDEPIDDPLENEDPENGVNYSIVRFPNPMYVEVDDAVGDYNVNVTGQFMRPNMKGQYANFADCTSGTSTKIKIEKIDNQNDLVYITVEPFKPKGKEDVFDKPYGFSIECPVKKYISADNKDISLNIIPTTFEVNLKESGIYTNGGYNVEATISGSIYKDNFNINFFLPLIWSASGVLNYGGFADIYFVSQYENLLKDKPITYTEVKIDSDGNIITDNENVQVEEAFTLKDCVGKYFDPEMSGTAGSNKLSPTPTTVNTSRIDSRTLKIELKNFSMEGVNVGDITAKCKAVLNEDGESYSLSGTTSVSFMGLVTLNPVVTGVIRKNQLQLNIHIDKVPAVSTVDVIYNGTRQE